MKKFLPAKLLIIAPYVFLLIAVLSFALEGSLSIYALMAILLSYAVIVLAIYLPNIIYALILLGRGEESENLFRLNFMLKMAHIPFFIAMFLLGLFMTVAIIFTLPLILIVMIMDVFLLIASSAYGIVGVIRARMEKKISVGAMILHIWLHLCFVGDIISAIYFYVKTRRKKGIRNPEGQKK